MATYRDPYAGHSGYQHNNYDDGPGFDPYYTNPGQQEPATYGANSFDPYQDNGGYRDEPVAPFPPPKESSGTLYDESALPRSRTATAKELQLWRHENRGNLWVKGGRGRCVGRFCCCSLMTAVFLVVSILLTLVLFLRPPNILISGVGAPPSGAEVTKTNDTVSINLGVNISVANPNYLSANFKNINAQIFYPINNTLVGNGTLDNIVISSHATTNFTFPFAIAISDSLTSDGQILLDLAQKCGIIGSSKQDITVKYNLALGIRVLGITITPVISNSISFACPLTSSDLEGILGSSGLSGLGSLLGGSS